MFSARPKIYVLCSSLPGGGWPLSHCLIRVLTCPLGVRESECSTRSFLDQRLSAQARSPLVDGEWSRVVAFATTEGISGKGDLKCGRLGSGVLLRKQFLFAGVLDNILCK